MDDSTTDLAESSSGVATSATPQRSAKWMGYFLLVAAITAVTWVGISRRSAATPLIIRTPVQFRSVILESGPADGAAEFVIENPRETEATLMLVRHSCGCAPISANGVALKPGDSIAVPPLGSKVLSTSVRVGSASQRRLSFDFVDSDNPQSLIQLELNVCAVAPLRVEPQMIACRFRDSDAAPLQRSLRVIRARHRTAPRTTPSITALPAHAEMLSLIEATPSEFPDGEIVEDRWICTLEISAPQQLDERMLFSRINVRLDTREGGLSEEVLVNVCKSAGVLAPREVNFGDTHAGQRKQRRILIYSASGEKFKIESLVTEGMLFSATKVNESAASRQWIDLEATSFQPGMHSGQLELRTDLADDPGVVVNLRMHVIEPPPG